MASHVINLVIYTSNWIGTPIGICKLKSDKSILLIYLFSTFKFLITKSLILRVSILPCFNERCAQTTDPIAMVPTAKAAIAWAKIENANNLIVGAERLQ
jgi:hypothetical protein